jgi:hypothetical protein
MKKREQCLEQKEIKKESKKLFIAIQSEVTLLIAPRNMTLDGEQTTKLVN